MEIYIVKSGDTVDSVALENEVSVESVLYNNQIEYPYALAVGQALLLTKGTPSNERKTVSVNGYAYPFINSDVLNQTLPYLSALSVFSYGFSAEGDLIYPPLDDTFMIEAAIQFQAAPILTLTPFGPDGQFSNYLINRVINNWEAAENLIQQITETVQAKGFQGVDVDFEYILPEDRVTFAEFVGRLREAINAIGYPVSVALAPKTSDTQEGLLYAGKDYALLGEAADSVLLMTYEWGYTYGPPMAVAPINKVREVVEYAITRIPEYKIDLGIPNYGYDWTLPFVKGESKARTIGNIEAIEIAVDNNAEIQFDPVAMSPYFRYTRDGLEHEVWFEDVRSMEAKFNLVKEFDLRGMGYWQVMKLFRANWLLLADTFWIEKQSE
ncbi:spore germination protein [Anaerosporobacter mobilis DSM 15930]|jgi:spore germination protein|uniref:Spore germination protein n=1 Tax=Anaerosporobacter mobilis DSM 15930 TaxID=1120996 RepID=A0A1M7N5V6_9FIRM|nr:glycosyl hydrolase family 18 protein [Anaerosporobacter mobilis]SHM98851.1 spore germination protein [Anaerosporobacter mobilis DSM 15930]